MPGNRRSSGAPLGRGLRARVLERLPDARRQLERKSRALIDLGLNVQSEIEQLHQPLYDAQAKTVSVARGVGRDADLIELVIDMCQCVSGDSDAGVENFHAHGCFIVQTSQAHAAFSRVLDRVRNEVAKDLPDE